MSSTGGEEAIAKVKAAGKDYYKILGVAKDADEASIKKAYRKLALQLHPDKCKLDGAEEAFKSISAAYNCLSTESSRRTYDMTGGEGPMGGGGGGRNPFEGAGIDPNEIFEQFFRQNAEMGGGFPGGGGFGGGFPGGGQTFFFSTNGMNGMQFSSMGGGGNPFFNMMNMNNMNGGGGSRSVNRRRQAQSQEGGDENDGADGDAPQTPPSIEQLLPTPLKILVPVVSAIAKVVPPQILLIGGIGLGTVFMSLVVRVLLQRLFYVILIFSVAPANLKWKLLGGLLLLHSLGVLP